MKVDYFYDEQIKRYLMQMVRAFSGFQYEIITENGKEYRTVPCAMASTNRQVANILRNNSENTALSVPYISINIVSVDIARELTRSPSVVDKRQVWEREIDPETNEYTGNAGNKLTVERMVPHPLKLTINVDIWTSNEHQKHQLFEQIYMAFNVGFTIQNSDNPLDWTSRTDIELLDVEWSSRSVPSGTTDEIDIMTFTFEMPMHINPPAVVTSQKVIEQIVYNIHDGKIDYDYNDYPDGQKADAVINGKPLVTHITTPQNATISVNGNNITLHLASNESTYTDEPIMDWKSYLDQYGVLRPSVSRLMLLQSIESKTAVVGTIQYTDDPNVIHWQPDMDTLPVNTLKAIDGVIDPLVHTPMSLKDHIQIGTRLLITNDIGQSKAWGYNGDGYLAHTQDIIELTDSGWVVTFSAAKTDTLHYVTNSRSGKQLKFDNHLWSNSIDSEYPAGLWRIKL